MAEEADVRGRLESSADSFRRVPPNYNACLNDARVALETLARMIAKARLSKHPGGFDETKWGQVLAYLRASRLVTAAEEGGLAGVYGFISPGSHKLIGISEEEMVRLGRSLLVSMCYFLVKKHNG